MRSGVAFSTRHDHERVHVGPLRRRLSRLLTTPEEAAVVVHADTRAPVADAWNIQIFHGLGDKGYVSNPLFLQEGWHPRARTAMNRFAMMLGLPATFLHAPGHAGKRRSRYQQVNAYGPRFADRFEDMLEDVEVSRFGHVPLNDRPDLRPDPEGPLLWVPTWDNSKYLGGADQSSLGPFAHEVALVSREVPVRIKYHPLTLVKNQQARARRELETEPGISTVPADGDPYAALQGCRGVLTDTSSLGFEAYCMGFPVAIAKTHGVELGGLHAELEERCTVLHSGKPDLLGWALDPDHRTDTAWVRDLLFTPSPQRNDAFASAIADRADPS